MAILVPDIEEINNLPQKPTQGEICLMEALVTALDDQWTVYFQPHLNGLRPDIVIFCEDAGIGIFEVKDWDLDAHRIIHSDDGYGYNWQVRARDTGEWVTTSKEDNCPLKQAEKYRDSIFKYEIPILDAERLLNQKVHSLIQPLVYFHKHTTADVRNRLQPILNQHSHVFGYDSLNPNFLRAMLAGCHLKHGSHFTKLMQKNEIAERLKNALAYPKHGHTDIQSLLVSFNKKQQELLPNTSGCRRVFGSAGSGKTLLLVHKAVNAAREGKTVLLVCFNITMANNLRDLVTRLARHYGPHYHRNIEVGHFHRFFPYPEENTQIDNRNIKRPVDVILIDEGQDFERFWIQILQKIAAPGYHLMFCEDDRQNIYGKNVQDRAIPDIRGRRNRINASYRIPEQTAALANALYTWAKQESESGTVTSVKAVQRNLFVRNIWVDGTKDEVVNAIKEDVRNLVQDKNTARADIAILICTVEDGWRICQALDELQLPYQQNFESQEENKEIYRLYGNNYEQLKRKRDELRRAYKAGFWMQGGRIKICTIHSFKGWELSNIFVFFNPEEEQAQAKVSLLYTAITRSQQSLTIYNLDSDLTSFGKIAISELYIEQYPSKAKS
ncbi:MAG: AAA family ATPase [Nostoc sp. LLA-1]|nr:AAA family ATPase [Cyanocohniella sp. LLY]